MYDLIYYLSIVLVLSLERDDSFEIPNCLLQVISIIHLNSVETVNLLDVDNVVDNEDIELLNETSINNKIISHSIVILLLLIEYTLLVDWTI